MDFTITVTVANSEGSATGSMVLNLSIAPPTYLGTLTGQQAVEGVPFSYATAPAFAGKQLTFVATGLPAGLAINPTSGVISGTVPA